MGWTEENSQLYQQLAAVAVPARADQLATLITLFPFGKMQPFRVVELASGEGILSEAILTAFPNASLLALDVSDAMRQATTHRLLPFGSRAEVAAFHMASADWYPMIQDVDCVISSLCVHHLDGEQKQALFAEVYQRLSEQGAFLLADLIQPQREEARRLFAATWDYSAKAQSMEKFGSSQSYDSFTAEHWNYYTYPDSFDKPSALFDQLMWLKSAGFAVVDVYWMQAGHAIYGGYKSALGSVTEQPVVYDEALSIAKRVLGD